MTGVLSRLMRVRERTVERATALVEVRRQILAQAKLALSDRDRLIKGLELQSERAAGGLEDDVSGPASRMSALVRIEALAADCEAALQARAADAVVVADAVRLLQEGRQALGRARARLGGLEVLARAEASVAVRRRERMAELDQECRRSAAAEGGSHGLFTR